MEKLHNEGDVAGTDVLELAVHVWRARFTGALRFEHGNIIKILYFKDGDIVAATSNDLPDNLGEILVRQKKLTKDHVKQALLKMPEGSTLGESLVTLGFITRKELLWALRLQVVEVVSGLSQWDGGTYNLVEGALPKRSDPAAFFTPHIIMDCIFRIADREKVLARLGGDDIVFAPAADFMKQYKQLDLNEEADLIIAKIDGRRSLSQIAGMSKMDPFDTYKLVSGLQTLGLLAPSGSEAVLATAAPASVPAAAGIGDDLEADFSIPSSFEPTVSEETYTLGESSSEAASLDAPSLEAPSWDMDFAPTVDVTPGGMLDEGMSSSVRPEELLPEEPEVPAPSLPAKRAEEPLRFPPPAEPAFAPPSFGESSGGMGGMEEEIDEIDGTVVAAARRPPAAGGSKPKEKRPTLQDLDPEIGPGSTADSAGKPPTARSASGRQPPELHFASSIPKKSRGPNRTMLFAGIAGALLLAGAAAWLLMRPSTKPGNAASSASPVRPGAGTPKPSPLPTSRSGFALVEEVSGTPSPAPASSAVPPAPASAVPDVSPGGSTTERAAAYRARYGSMPPESYTIQLMLACQEESLGRAAAKDAGGRLWFLTTDFRGRRCYRLYWGAFASRAEAEAAYGGLDAEFTAVASKPRLMTLREALR